MVKLRSGSLLENLGRTYGMYTGIFVGFVILLGIAEQMGMPARGIGYTFVGATIGVYAMIGIVSRTRKVSQQYVAGRAVPAFFNGIATGSDWVSAASFIGMAGAIYGLGYEGLAYVMGWTGGYVLLAVFLGPYLRKFGQYTIPDFLGARYGGHGTRLIGVAAAITASFAYLIAQITGVGIVMSRMLGTGFAIGVAVGLAGILLCSLLGGVKAVTWTQVAQYLILIIAYLVPVSVLSYKHTGVPISQIMYGQVLQKIDAREEQIAADPAERAVRDAYRAEAAGLEAKLKDVPAAMAADRAAAEARLAGATDPQEAAAARQLVAGLPATAAEARSGYSAARKTAGEKSAAAQPSLKPFARMDKKNMLALTFCLMVGTAGLPHILMRYYSVPSVRDARASVGWSLFFICLLFFTVPAYAAFARWEVLSSVVGAKIAELPAWMANWAQVGLVSWKDVNLDGILQFGELTIGADAIVLATPEIAGLPYVISGLVAAGGLAAALSTADGLLVTISNSFSHDLYYKVIDPNASIMKRMTISRAILVVTAAIAAWVATYKLAIIVELVAWAFSLAAASFFPALVMGVWDKRANRAGALWGMLAGFGVTLFYMVGSRFFGLDWWGIRTVSSGLFGIPLGFVTIYAVSRMTTPPSRELQEFVESVRYPNVTPGTISSD